MTTSPLQLLQDIPVTTQHDLATLWAAILGDGGFARRTLWFAVLEESGRPARVIVPIDDIPLLPEESHVEGLRTVVAGLAECGTAILLISRPGPDVVQDNDLTWARALIPLSPSWPVHLATSDIAGNCTVRPLNG